MVGCRLNQSELERMGNQARQAGHELVAEVFQADLAIINTCAVTAKAAADSRKLVRKIARDGDCEIVLTGCWASLEPDAAASLPGVTQIIPNGQKDELHHLSLNPIDRKFEATPYQRQPLPGTRKRTRAFIKVQDGCGERCAFCLTTIARGNSKSVCVPQILEEIQAASAGGVKEVILTGVQLGAYGKDFPDGGSLAMLLRNILDHTAIPRIRLSSLEPWGLTDDLLDVWTDPRVCRQMHLPLQSGSETTLKHMARNVDPGRFRSLVERIRQRFPNMAITTDIIVGFPGECESTFEESLAFVRSLRFAGGHVFTFSARPGTMAAGFANRVPHSIRRERNQRMRAAIDRSAREYQTSFLGSNVAVLWHGLRPLDGSGFLLHGLASEGLRIQAQGTEVDHNHIHDVLITGRNADGSLEGQISQKQMQA